MGSKKVLEEMYELVTEKTDEPIEESKFNESILKSLKVKTIKERNEVLNELLIKLKSGNESIGRISNGMFICFPDIIERVENLVIQRLETEELYIEKTENNAIVETEDKKSNVSNNIDDLIQRFDELNDVEFRNLFENLGKMDDFQMNNFLENYKKNQEPLVESGIKEQKEIDEDEKYLKLVRAIQGNEEEIRTIASLMISIESDIVDSHNKTSYIMKLYTILKEKDLSEDTKKFCEDMGIYETVERMMQTIDNKPRVDTLNDRTDIPLYDINLVATLQSSIWQETTGFDLILAQFKRAQKKGNYDLCMEILKENNLTLDFFEQSTDTQDLVLKQLREQKKITVVKKHAAKLVKVRQNSAEERNNNAEQRETTSPTRVKKPAKIRKLSAKRDTLQFGGSTNEQFLENIVTSNGSLNGMPINDFEISDYFERFSATAVVGNIETVQTKSVAEPVRNRPIVAEIIVETAKQMSTRLEGFKKLITTKGSKDSIEEASSMLFDLATEIDLANRNESRGNRADSNGNVGKIGDDSKAGETPEEH